MPFQISQILKIFPDNKYYVGYVRYYEYNEISSRIRPTRGCLYCWGWAGVMTSRHKEIESNYMLHRVADIESYFTT